MQVWFVELTTSRCIHISQFNYCCFQSSTWITCSITKSRSVGSSCTLDTHSIVFIISREAYCWVSIMIVNLIEKKFRNNPVEVFEMESQQTARLPKYLNVEVILISGIVISEVRINFTKNSFEFMNPGFLLEKSLLYQIWPGILCFSLRCPCLK